MCRVVFQFSLLAVERGGKYVAWVVGWWCVGGGGGGGGGDAQGGVVGVGSSGWQRRGSCWLG